VEDDSLPYAPLVLRRTDRDHRSMFPRSDWRVRVLHLGFVPDRFQAVPFNTSIGICSNMEEGILFFRRGLSTAGFHRAPGRRSQNGFRPPHGRPPLR